MRILAIGDMHGCSESLERLAEFVPISDHDLLITLGDYVDRGPNSRRILDWLIERDRKGGLIPLRGNHELMALAARDADDALREWLFVGAVATLQSYTDDPAPWRIEESWEWALAALERIPPEHWTFLEERLRPYHEIDTHFFVHANAVSEYPLAEQPPEMLYWEHLWHDVVPHVSGKTMVCGHTPQRSGLPLNLGHAVCIDTAPFHGGWLTCFEPASGRIWQANEAGETRQDWLPEPRRKRR